MWAYAAVRRSAQPLFVRASPRITATSLSSFNTQDVSRHFSSDNNDGKNRKQGGNQGGGKINWKRKGNNNNNDRRNNNKGRRPKKQNFSDKFLEPAARGELKKHRSGIPKLAGRRPKGRGVRGADVLPEGEEEWGYNETDEDVEFTSNKKSDKNKSKIGSMASNSPVDELNPEEYKEVMNFFETYRQISTMADDEQYYWDEVDYDDSGLQKKLDTLQQLRSEATKDADGNLVVEVEDDVFNMFDAAEGGSTKDFEPEKKRQGGFTPIADDPAFKFVMENMGIDSGKAPPGPGYDQVQQLDVNGSDMSDFVEAMMKHPTKFSEMRYTNLHPESTREPVADLPPNRINPSQEFLEAHIRFLYIWGLPQLMVNGQPGDIESPVDCMEIQKTVASLFDVSTDSVSAASLTSAFVGFPSAVDQRIALAVGPITKVLESSVVISRHTPKDGSDSCVLLENVPIGCTPSSLATTLFPANTEVGEVHGDLTSEDIIMVSPNSALLRYKSAEIADNTVASSIVKERLVELRQHQIRYAKARRELVYSGKHGGPDGQDRLRQLGSKLIVDGDMPTKKFFLSHAGTLYLRNLDPKVTKQEISDFFQDFCTVSRDVEGSIEFVSCHNGLSTGRAYVSFDELGEAEAAMAALAKKGGRISLGGNRVVVKSVKELNKIDRERRQSRSEEELLDSLHNWEQFVNPADVDELVKLGISKEALDEALTAIRYQNPTFSSLDQAMRSETLETDKKVGGMYKELVKEYISTLKECASTPENPGPIYESLFFPDEEIDTEIFEDEVDRQEELQRQRELP